MEPHALHESTATSAPLVVADWRIEAEGVVAACRTILDDAAALHLLVPAWLHGVDWAGDPFGSVPCAQRQAERIAELCVAAGLRVESCAVGDPDPVSAICDAVAAARVGEILLFARGRHASSSYPLSVARRARRLTGLPLQSFGTAMPPRPRRRPHLAGGHCRPARAPQVV
jgi:hypothetical protein